MVSTMMDFVRELKSLQNDMRTQVCTTWLGHVLRMCMQWCVVVHLRSELASVQLACGRVLKKKRISKSEASAKHPSHHRLGI